MNISYEFKIGNFAYVEEKLIEECSELYSTQYGIWSKNSPKNSGKNIKLSPTRLKKWLENENSAIYMARDENLLVGYAIAIRLKVPKFGIISWVTQLVVHENYRHRDIAKNLLYSIWGFTDDYAWGIISANPYAVRALEKATRRRTDPARTKHNIKKLISIGAENIPYLSKDIEYFITKEASKINT